MERKVERIIYLDILRIAASFAVVFLHVACQNIAKVNVNSFNFNVLAIYNGIVRWAVPCFVMISGSLFLDKDFPISKIYKKYISRIIIAFIFWSLLYAIYSVINGNIHNLKTFIEVFFRGKYHLWYLYMIIGLYAITPFLRKIVEDKKLLKYFLILAFIFAIIVPSIIDITSMFSVRLEKLMNLIIKKSNFKFVLGYTIYYLLGYYLSKKEKMNKVTNLLIYVLGIASFLLTGLLSIVVSRHGNKLNEMFYNELSINVFFESIFIFTLFKQIFSKITISPKLQDKISYLSKCTFGVYLVHPLFLDILRYTFKINSLTFNPIFSVWIISIGIFIISFIFSIIINKIRFLNKWIV